MKQVSADAGLDAIAAIVAIRRRDYQGMTFMLNGGGSEPYLVGAALVGVIAAILSDTPDENTDAFLDEARVAFLAWRDGVE